MTDSVTDGDEVIGSAGRGSAGSTARGGTKLGPIRPGRLRAKLAELARKHQVPGAQLALYRGGETISFAHGELEHGTGRGVSEDAAFPIGSITKSFTAAVAMALVADGDLELDAPLRGHLRELDDLGALLTLRRLLSHTGGLADGPDLATAAACSLRRHVLDHCHRGNLVLPPGTGFSYSNLGYALVGRLIETTTGMSWFEAVESILLRPLGIEPAFITTPGNDRPARPVATGHSSNPATGRTRPVDQSLAPAEAPAGALAVSAADLVALGTMHVGRGVPELLPATHAALQRQVVPAADPFGLADGWASGLAVFREGPATWVGHDGNADGTACHLRIHPENGWVIAFTSNANTGVGLWRDLRDELAGMGIPTGRPAATLPGPATEPPRDCLGTYVNGDVEYVVDRDEDGHLRLAADGDDVERLTFHRGFVFSLADPTSCENQVGGRFVRDPVTGDVDGIQIGGRFARRLDYTVRAVVA